MAEPAVNELESPRAAAKPADAKAGRKARRFAVLAVAAAVAAGGWWFASQQRASSQPAEAPGSDSATTVLPLDSFTVNLADPEDGHFLRVTIALGVAGKLPTTGKAQSKALESSAVSIAVIRDSILNVLAQSKSGDLLTPDGKAAVTATLPDQTAVRSTPAPATTDEAAADRSRPAPRNREVR